MNNLQNDPISFASQRELELEIARLAGLKCIAESRLRWLANSIEAKQEQLKAVNQLQG